MYKPHLLTHSRYNPPSEVRGAAEWCAYKNLKGVIGDPLPEGLSLIAFNWINQNKSTFVLMVMRQRAKIDYWYLF